MKDYVAKYSIAIIVYCLMPNHYHWLVRQDGIVEARVLPQRVFNGYVVDWSWPVRRTLTGSPNPLEERGL